MSGEEAAVQSSRPPAVLVVCRRSALLPILARMRPVPSTSYVLASDDPAVQAAAGQLAWVTHVCPMERTESFYAVGNDVSPLLDVVNDWLMSLGGTRAVPSDVLFWSKHVEGGMTGQRVQDAMLLIRAYRAIVTEFGITAIVLVPDARDHWENLILARVARGLGLSFRCQGPLWRRASATLRRFLALGRQVVRVLGTGRGHRSTRHGGAPSTSREAGRLVERSVAFELCSSELKHVDNILPVMRALRERGQPTVAVTWRAAGGAALVREAGFEAEELEHYLPAGARRALIVPLLATALRGLWKSGLLLRSEALTYQSVRLRPILWPSFAYFFCVDLYYRCLFRTAIRRFLERREPAMIKLWGGTALMEGRLTERACASGQEVQTLEYWLGPLAFDNPYEVIETPSGFYLAAGAIQQNRMCELGIPRERIAVVGQSRYDALGQWVRAHSLEDSRRTLGLKEGADFYVLFDANAPLRGYLSVHEQLAAMNALLEFAGAHPDCVLLVKPHPTHQRGLLEDVIAAADIPTVFLLNKDDLPYDALNAADLAITKMSTIGFEAMLMERPVISLILDHEPRWRSFFEDAVEYVESVDELQALLNQLAGDPVFRREWKAAIGARRAQFLKRAIVEMDVPAADRAAAAIMERLVASR